MTHDWVVLIMWFTSLFVTAWGQRWKAKADRLGDAIQYLLEEQTDDSGTDSDSGDDSPAGKAGGQDSGVDQP